MGWGGPWDGVGPVGVEADTCLREVEEKPERAQGGGPGTPTHADNGSYWLPGRQPPETETETETETDKSSVIGNAQSPLPGAADTGLIPAQVTAETKPSKPQRLSQSSVRCRKTKALAWNHSVMINGISGSNSDGRVEGSWLSRLHLFTQ